MIRNTHMEQPSPLLQRIHELEQEVNRLRNLLDQAGIIHTPVLHEEEITPQHALFFYSIFKGRKDVFSKRTPRKDGSAAYYPICRNFWKEAICKKRMGEKVRCSECLQREWMPLNQRVLMNHLIGIRDDGGDVIGIYPLLEDGNCNFLVFDFDSHDEPFSTEWKQDVDTLRLICQKLSVPILVERSRSGSGAHIWILFNEPIPAKTARQFGSALLTKGAESVNQRNFCSYDRMIPAQDCLPKGSLGNLIALPLQGGALKQGNSAFIDENWVPYPNQWEILRQAQRISPDYIEKKLHEWGWHGILGELTPLTLEATKEAEKPWERHKVALSRKNVNGRVRITYADMIYVEKHHLTPQAQNALRRLAAFSNPLFYRTQALGFSTARVPRIISCSRDEEQYIALPRGLKEELRQRLISAGIDYTEEDNRQQGNPLQISFNGTLYPEQQAAADAILKHETGVLHAATAFGKTAVGAYLVAKRKVNTLVLVHNREIMKNWVENFQKFLTINAPLPTYQTRTGRFRTRKCMIGCLHSSHDSTTGLLDIAMFSSLGSGDEISDKIRNYGMIIMDECHHAAARTAEEVLRRATARYVYGLTATPKRDDGMEPKMLMQLGPIRHRFTARQRAEMQDVQHFLYPRFTRLSNPGTEWKINEAYQALIQDTLRNQLILNDTLAAIRAGRTPLVLTKFRSHAALLQQQLAPHVAHVILLQGGGRNNEREQLRQQLRSIPQDEEMVVVAIAKYIGEGFNLPRLDTLMLATPIAWEGNVEQYAGRLHRDYKGKKEVIIYDYVDCNIRVLDNMYHKRLKAYKKIGYSLYIPGKTQPMTSSDSIFESDAYASALEQDISCAKQEIIIANPDLCLSKINWLTSLLHPRRNDGIRSAVITQSLSSYPPNRQASAVLLHARLQSAGIHLNTPVSLHQHFAIIDRNIVWYGNANLLSRDKVDTHLIRIIAPDIARELLASCARPETGDKQLSLF